MKKKKILLIDDEPEIQNLAKEILNDEDSKVYMARNCDETIKLIREESFDICFIDKNIPGKDGVACRDHIPKEVDCYLMTGELAVEEELQLKKKEFKGLFSKPLDWEKLKEVIVS